MLPLEKTELGFRIVIPSKYVSNLEACLKSIRENEPDAEVIVIDDGLSFQPPGPTYILGTYPFNFSTNVNLGIGCAGPLDVIVMNDDALLTTPSGLSELAKVTKANPEFGLVSSSCNVVGNTRQNPQPEEPERPLRLEPRMVCFVCVYIPRTTIDKVGVLDSAFTAYGFQDDDYCLRVRKSGLKIGIFDGCFVDHSKLLSTYRGRSDSPMDLEPGRKIFEAKWGKGSHGTL
jgi:GT2 family glycosyltransferase